MTSYALKKFDQIKILFCEWDTAHFPVV